MIRVLVDIDETMLSVPPGINAQTFTAMFKKIYGIDANEEMIDNVGKTEKGIIIEVLSKFGIQKSEIPQEAYRIWAEAMDERLQKEPVKILPGMKDFLEELSRRRNAKLVLLTGNSPWRAMSKLKSAGFDEYFLDEKTGLLRGVFGDMTGKRDELFTILKSQSPDEDKIRFSGFWPGTLERSDRTYPLSLNFLIFFANRQLT